jgi:hypothetical protein
MCQTMGMIIFCLFLLVQLKFQPTGTWYEFQKEVALLAYLQSNYPESIATLTPFGPIEG